MLIEKINKWSKKNIVLLEYIAVLVIYVVFIYSIT